MNCGLMLVRVSTRRPAVVTFLAVLYFLGGLSLAGGAIYAANLGRRTEVVMLSGVGIGIAIAAMLYAVMTYGMISMKSWARVLQLIFAFLMLPAIPFGTIIGIVLLIYFFKPGLRALFSGRPPEQFTPQELASVQQVQANSGAGVILTICAVIVLNVISSAAFVYFMLPRYMQAIQQVPH